METISIKYINFKETYIHKLDLIIILLYNIFINSISQDVLAATLLEYLCGGAVILNGKWLDYPELDYYGIKCQQYEIFEELPIKIGDCIKNNSITLQEKNSQLIWKYLSWNSYEWLQLYV